MRNDRGDVILGFFTKIAVVLSVFAVIGFDAVSIGVAHMNTQDTANTAAQSGADAWNANHDADYALHAAAEVASEHGMTVDVKAFRIDKDGTVHVRLTKDATTLLLYRTGKTKKWAHVTATGHGRAE
jgi:hypothetical protein